MNRPPHAAYAPRRGQACTALVTLVFAFIAACARPPSATAPPEYRLGPPNTIVSEASGILASPVGLALDTTGDLYVLDRTDRRIVHVSPTGALLGTIARPGSGPGELRVPLAFGVDAEDSIRVFDFSTGSVEVFSADGRYEREYRADISGIPSRIAFGGHGRVAYAGTHPNDQGALVAVLDRSGRQVALLDTLVRRATAIPPNLLDVVHQRRLPDFMRNNALPMLTADGGAWLFLQTEAELEHFGPDDSMDTRLHVALPELATISNAYFEWYAHVHAPDMLRYFTYVEDGVVSGGNEWLLWQTAGDQPGLITVHDGAGNLCARLVLQGVATKPTALDSVAPPPYRRLAVDVERSRIYVLDRSTAAVWAFTIPRAVSARHSCGSI